MKTDVYARYESGHTDLDHDCSWWGCCSLSTRHHRWVSRFSQFPSLALSYMRGQIRWVGFQNTENTKGRYQNISPCSLFPTFIPATFPQHFATSLSQLLRCQVFVAPYLFSCLSVFAPLLPAGLCLRLLLFVCLWLLDPFARSVCSSVIDCKAAFAYCLPVWPLGFVCYGFLPLLLCINLEKRQFHPLPPFVFLSVSSSYPCIPLPQRQHGKQRYTDDIMLISLWWPISSSSSFLMSL